MVQNNLYRKSIEEMLGEIKEFVLKFPHVWINKVFLPWETYETLLVKEKSKIDSSHEKITILKGFAIVNYLVRYFQLLWLVKTLFMEKPTYNQISNFRMAHVKFIKYPSSNLSIWKECRGLMPPSEAAKPGPSTSDPAQKLQVTQ